ncbi:MAG: 4-hydroxy-tetrahydrodipicolinate synthase [Dokdonella sp.]
MNPNSLVGSFCALATPFNDDDDAAIDFDAFGRLVEFQIQGGTRGLIAAGSTGEAAALDDAEFSALLRFCVEAAAKRCLIGAGTGQSSTRRTIAMTRRAADAGVDFALVVTPPYVRATQDGLVRHYHEVADQGGLPIMLYNVPGRTGSDLLPETVARLVDHKRIVGIKEAVPEPARMRDLLALQTESFAVFSGDDATFADAVSLGARGVISVSANVAPDAIQSLYEAAVTQSSDRQSMDAQLQALHRAMGLQSNPIPVKWALSRLGIGSARLRLPLLSLAKPYHGEVESVVASLPRPAHPTSEIQVER